ncbi:hypothetical protein CDAR_549331 [Caerostris darwini]|uniref:BTB domain-containing protein n=1 Tax=Caerostris darwini TaxID=1538125 RepID=A0AAV4XA97_9ARAC|nr:hypothetical protein CDAR_549331 [Caerostris darwini]
MDPSFGIGSSFYTGMKLTILQRLVYYSYTGIVVGLSTDLNIMEELHMGSIDHLRLHFELENKTYKRVDITASYKQCINVSLRFEERDRPSTETIGPRRRRYFNYASFRFIIEVLTVRPTGAWLTYTGVFLSDKVEYFEVLIFATKQGRTVLLHGERFEIGNVGDSESSSRSLFLGSKSIFGNLFHNNALQLSIQVIYEKGSSFFSVDEEKTSVVDEETDLVSLSQSLWRGLNNAAETAGDLVILPSNGERILCHKLMFRARLLVWTNLISKHQMMANEIQTISTHLNYKHVMYILEYIYQAKISDDLRNHRYDEVRQFGIDSQFDGLKRFFQVYLDEFPDF